MANGRRLTIPSAFPTVRTELFRCSGPARAPAFSPQSPQVAAGPAVGARAHARSTSDRAMERALLDLRATMGPATATEPPPIGKPRCGAAPAATPGGARVS